MSEQAEEERKALRTMHGLAAVLALSPDPILRGQYVALLGRITALLTIVEGAVPEPLETAALDK